MYVGGTGPMGRLHLALEVIENSIDQAVGGKASSIEVQLRYDGSIEVIDDGEGIDLSNPETLGYFSAPHTTASADGHQPHVHVGLHGVGLAVVNMLCSRLVCETTHAGVGYRAEWSNGTAQFDGVRTWPGGRGTSIRLWPDPSIFDDGFPAEQLESRLNEFAGLIPDLHVRAGDQVWQPLPLDRSLGRLLPGGEAPQWGQQPLLLDYRGVLDNVDFELASLVRLSTNPSGQMNCYVNYREVSQRCALTDLIHRSFSSNLQGSPLLFGNLDVVLSLALPGARYSGPTRGAIEDPLSLVAVEEALAAKLPDLVTALNEQT